MIRILASLAVAWMVVGTAWARDIHVDNLAGDDRLDGGASDSVIGRQGPVRSISKALRLAEAGDRIVVANTSVPYQESLFLLGSRLSGGTLGPLIIEGNGATLDGSAPIPAEAWEHVADDVFVCRPAGLTWQQLFVDGNLAARWLMRPGERELPPLAPLGWCFSGTNIYFRVEPTRLPADYPLACCLRPAGITLSYVRDVVIHDLHIQGFHSDGLRVIDSAQGVRLLNVTSRANGRSGLATAGAIEVELAGCRLAENGESQLRCEQFSRVSLVKSELQSGYGAAIDAQGGRIWIDGEAWPGAEQANAEPATNAGLEGLDVGN